MKRKTVLLVFLELNFVTKHIFSCLFQAQGFVEHFTDKCGGVISWVNQVTQSIAFAEGWGLYAELLIAEDTDSYEDRLWQKYGALKWRVC